MSKSVGLAITSQFVSTAYLSWWSSSTSCINLDHSSISSQALFFNKVNMAEALAGLRIAANAIAIVTALKDVTELAMKVYGTGQVDSDLH